MNDRGTADLCPFDPGFPVDIYITTDIRTMIRLWFAKLSLEAATRSDLMEIVGAKASPGSLEFLVSSEPHKYEHPLQPVAGLGNKQA